MSLIKCIPILACCFLANCLGAQPLVQKKFQWHQKGFYILNPAFAHHSNELVFVRKFSGRDSVLPAGNFTKGAYKNYLSPQAAVARINDPVITLLNTADSRFSLIDFGWAPVFSPADHQIAYACQVQPLQKADRLYAASFKGNYLKLFNRNSGKTEVLTTVQNNYQLDPFFADSANLVYKTGATVNGPYGSGVSFNQLNLVTKKSVTIRLPAIKYRLYALMGDAYKLNDKIAYTVYSPADTGRGMATVYQHLLLSGRDTLHNFGTRAYTDLTYKFAYNKNKELRFLQDNRFATDDTSFLITYKGDKMVRKQPVPFRYSKGYLSPNGDFLLYITQEKEAFVVNTENWAATKLDLPAEEFHAVKWNDQGDQLALVQDHDKLEGTDMLYLFSIKPR